MLPHRTSSTEPLGQNQPINATATSAPPQMTAVGVKIEPTKDGLTIIGVNDYWQSVAQGIILAFAVGTDYYSRTHVKTTLRTAKS